MLPNTAESLHRDSYNYENRMLTGNTYLSGAETPFVGSGPFCMLSSA
jgi:hypothetical protein